MAAHEPLRNRWKRSIKGNFYRRPKKAGKNKQKNPRSVVTPKPREEGVLRNEYSQPCQMVSRNVAKRPLDSEYQQCSSSVLFLINTNRRVPKNWSKISHSSNSLIFFQVDGQNQWLFHFLNQWQSLHFANFGLIKGAFTGHTWVFFLARNEFTE